MSHKIWYNIWRFVIYTNITYVAIYNMLLHNISDLLYFWIYFSFVSYPSKWLYSFSQDFLHFSPNNAFSLSLSLSPSNFLQLFLSSVVWSVLYSAHAHTPSGWINHPTNRDGPHHQPTLPQTTRSEPPPPGPTSPTISSPGPSWPAPINSGTGIIAAW